MNRNLYKVIFNKKRGCMMAVAENTVRDGKNVQDGSAVTASDGKGVCFPMHVAVFSVLLATGSVMMAPAYAAGILADKSAPGAQQPTILQTANGLPQVNIQTPSAAGVSLNQFRQFDVDNQGAVLNNSRTAVRSQLGGWVQGNPWLAAGEARIIVNQVNSTHPSLLNGYIEVAGRRAEVVVANPAGIQVNGGGFIHAAGVTLTTGKPVVDNGRLSGFQVRDGQIAVGGGGLDTSSADYTRILSRAAQINAGIWAERLSVVAGNGDVDADGAFHTASADTPAPAVAIDTGVLGGMYAGKITLLSHDAGAEIRNAGQVFAGAGGVTLSAEGKIGNSGSIVVSGSADSAALTLKAADLTNSGTVSTQGGAVLSTRNLNNSGLMAASGEWVLDNHNRLDNSGTITAGRMDVTTRSLDNSGTIAQTGLQGLALSAGQTDNSGHIGHPADPAQEGSGVSDTAHQASAPTGAAGGGSVAATVPTAPALTWAEGRIAVSDGLTNSGDITANGGIGLTAHNGLTNRSELHLNTLDVSGGLLDNQSGRISAQQATVHTQTLDNRQGELTAVQSLAVQSRAVDNRDGRLQSGGTLAVSAQDLNNEAGQIAAEDAAISAQRIDNRNGSMDAGRLVADAAALDNGSGALRSDTATVLRISDGLNNANGLISSAEDTGIHDGGGQTLSIDNTSGEILAGHNLDIQAQTLVRQGILAAGHNLSLALKDSLTVEEDIRAGQGLSLSSEGSIRNSHTLEGGTSVYLNAAAIDNAATGKIQSGSDTRLSADNITNRGLINSNGLTLLKADEGILNTGTGRVYGDRIALGASVLTNREEAAGGETKAAVVVARERLDIGAKEIVNREAAILSSEGRLNIGGRLDEAHQAQDHAEHLSNNSARIEAKGDAAIAVNNLKNLNNHFAVEEYLDSQKHIVSYTRQNETEAFFTEGIDGTSKLARHDFNLFYYDGRNEWFHKGQVIGLWKSAYDQSVYKQRIIENKPAEIIIGGNLTASSGHWLNKNSFIMAGGILNDEAVIKNEATPSEVRIVNDGYSQQASYRKNSRWHSADIRFDQNKTAVASPPVTTEPFKETVSEVAQNVTNLPPSAAKTAGLNLNPTVIQTDGSHAASIKSLDQTGRLPTSALYTINPQNPAFIIETDPAFADYRQWLGSDYMLSALNQDPANMHKRLGDGYYEQRLINEQIARLTGYRRLDGYSNDEAQFKALMDNGITYAHTHNLTPGIALSAEQVARLTSDIVWLEPQSYTLSDGSSITVLVPKVYVVAREGDLNNAGGLISAEQIQLHNDNDLTNSGTIAGRSIVDLSAHNISNSGLIQGGKVRVKAADTLTVNGGSIAADTALIAQAQNIRVETSTASTGDKQNGSTTIDRVAGLYVNNASDGLMLVEAGTIDFVGATVRNEAANGQTVIRAENNLNLGTVQTENHESYGALDDKNHRHAHTVTEIGTQIQTVGDIALTGRDITARQADIDSANGDIILNAQNNLNITEGRKTTVLDDSVYQTGKRPIGKSTYQQQVTRNDNEAVSGSITGNRVIINSGNDTLIRGTDIVSDKLTQITAGGDIAIEAAQSRYTGHEFHQTKKSGLMGSGGIGFTIGSKKDTTDTDSTTLLHTGNTVGSLAGNTVIQAGGNYAQTGSTVSSPQGDVLIRAQNIDIASAQDQYGNNTTHIAEQKGLTIALNIPVVEAAQSAVQAAKAVGQSKNGRVNAMAAANAGWQSARLFGSDAAPGNLKGAADAAGALADGNLKGAGQSSDISVSITYGQQKSTEQSRIRGTEAQASQILAGGQVSLIADNDKGDAHIRITGSDVAGKGSTLLAADDIRLLSAEQTHSERSDNRSSGFNAGVAVSYGQSGMALGFTAGGNYGKGYGNGDETTHRHSHIGDAGSRTVIHSSGDVNIKGAQVTGKGIALEAQNLNIESVQDSASFNSRQQNISGQVTVGYGASGNANYSRSKINADHASVTEQSGLFAGDDGFQVNVKGHTDLKGGIITATDAAEQNGNNRFQTASLTHSDLENHSRYEGESFGIGVGGSLSGSSMGMGGYNPNSGLKNVADANSVSNTLGYGSDSESRSSLTRSGIGTRNIVIADDPTGTQAQAIYTDIRSETAEQNSGRLNNAFDRDSVQKELDLQREVSQTFSRNVQEAGTEINKKVQAHQNQADVLDTKANEALIEGNSALAGILAQEAALERKKAEDWQRGGVALNMVAAGLSAPTQSGAGIAAAIASPALSHQIGQYFKELATDNPNGTLTPGQEAAHTLAHAVLGAAVAAAGGNDALTGALAAGGAEAAAPVISHYLYGEKDGSKLDAEQKETVAAISGLLGVGAGAVIGSAAADAVQGSLSALGAVENNYLTKAALEKIQTGKLTIPEAEKLSQSLDKEVNRLCSKDPTSDACRTGISNQIKYIAMKEAWEVMHSDVSRTAHQTFDYLYNTPDANSRFTVYFNSIDARADFFGASNQYEKNLGVGAKWFGGAEEVSRACITGLGADGCASYLSFGMGKLAGNPDLYGWRKEAGDALMHGGFKNFKDLYNNKQDAMKWDIKQLKDEQNLLQPIHEKYLKEYDFFRNRSKEITDRRLWGLFNNRLDESQIQSGGIDLLDKKSRIRYGCKLLGYTKEQGCAP